MIEWIRAGADADPALPREGLTPPELEELRSLVAARERTVAALEAVERQIALFVTGARDRRGLLGPVRVSPIDGRIVVDASASAKED